MRTARALPVQDADRGESAVFAFIEGFYNPRRRHSSIGYLSPIDYEHRHHAATVDRDAHQPAAVLAAVKDKPFGRPQDAAVRDRHCAAAASVRGSGRKNGSAGGRTKECYETGGQHAVKPESLIQALTSPRNRGKSTLRLAPRPAEAQPLSAAVKVLT